MDRFIMHHPGGWWEPLSCFDRVIFKGHLPLTYLHDGPVFTVAR
jgi:hypothetical protein